MTIDVPGAGSLTLETIILDLNGTVSVGGEIPEGVKERLQKLKEKGLKIVLFTGNTRGNADDIVSELGIQWQLAKNAEEKRDLALRLNPDTCVSIGNGIIDLEMMKIVGLSVLTLQAEGIHVKTFMHSDILVPTINDALDLLIDEDRLKATLHR